MTNPFHIPRSISCHLLHCSTFIAMFYYLNGSQRNNHICFFQNLTHIMVHITSLYRRTIQLAARMSGASNLASKVTNKFAWMRHQSLLCIWDANVFWFCPVTCFHNHMNHMMKFGSCWPPICSSNCSRLQPPLFQTARGADRCSMRVVCQTFKRVH